MATEGTDIRAILAEIHHNLDACTLRLSDLPTKNDLWSFGLYRLFKKITRGRKVMPYQRSYGGREEHKATAPQVAGPDPADVEAGAKAICFTFDGCQCEMMEQCTSWRGKISKYSRAVIAALVERGWTKPEGEGE